MQLYDVDGQRKYVTADERRRVLEHARALPRQQRTLVLLLVYTGCRLSEALNVRSAHVDVEGRRVIFESLKKRRRGVFRAVPVPDELIEALDLVHGIRESAARERSEALWTMSRTTAWRVVRAAMQAAEVKGPHGTAKGLRHGFGVNAVQAGVPLNLVQRWLGHAQLSTTAIYAEAMGEEELSIAERMWEPG